MTEKIKVIYCPKQMRPFPAHVDNAMQFMVNGLIETVKVADDTAIVCCKDAKENGMPCNISVPVDGFYGDVFMVGLAGDEFVSLSETQVAFYLPQAMKRYKEHSSGGNA